MSLSEFDLIERYFHGLTPRGPHTRIGIGDDAAAIEPPPGESLLWCTDTLVADVHYPADAPAQSIGHKALAVNLSDIAAMGGRPLAALLAITLPSLDEGWVEQFAAGFGALARRFQVELIGGDVTRGPTATIGVQVIGAGPAAGLLRRDTARPGDEVYVSGTLGDAALALRLWQSGCTDSQGPWAALLSRLHRPEPRLALGAALGGVAHAAIDLSDGLVADAGHLARASGAGLVLERDRLPASADFDQQAPVADRLALQCAGDDYELLFTAPAGMAAQIARIAGDCGTPVTRVGGVVGGSGVQLVDAAGQPLAPPGSGYRHFPGGDA